MKFKILFLLSICSVSVLNAQNRIYVNEYLNIGVGARALSMAGANSASSNDVYSGFWNPAGLMEVEDVNRFQKALCKGVGNNKKAYVKMC